MGAVALATRVQDLTGEKLRAALGYLRWTRERLAEESGVSPATIYRMLAQDGPIQARRGSIDRVFQAVTAAGAFRDDGAAEGRAVLYVELEPELLRRLPASYRQLARLWQISVDTRDQERILHELADARRRMSSVYEAEDGELRLQYLGADLPWSGETYRGRRLFDVFDYPLAVSAAQRIYKALITGEPVFAYCRRQSDDFTVLTVPCRIGQRPGVVSVSEPGRPDFSS